jgi:flagellin FlaB
VFIAMVLVAAIAAGVLIDTAGFLQSQSEAVGQESTSQTVDRILVISEIGKYDGELLYEVQLKVKKAPGADSVDLDQLMIHWLGPDGSDEITDYDVTAVKGSAPKLESDSDVMRINFTPKNLDPGERATVQLVGESGAKTTVRLRAPDPAPDGEAAEI